MGVMQHEWELIVKMAITPLITIGDKLAMECEKEVKTAYTYLKIVSATDILWRKMLRGWLMKVVP